MSAKNLDSHNRWRSKTVAQTMEKYHSRVSGFCRRKRTNKQGSKVIGTTETRILLPQMFRSGHCCSGKSESI